MVHEILSGSTVRVVPQSHSSFMERLALSLTDCISMNTMRERGIVEVLTNDQHLRQEGLVILMSLGRA
jgi:predicted nucleic acid-binding protein